MSYVSEVTADTPTGWWKLGESVGTVADDAISTNDGTYVNTPTLGVTGIVPTDGGTAVTFTPASSEEVTLPNNGLSGTGSIELWFKNWTTGTAIMRDNSGAGGWIIGVDLGDLHFSVRVAATNFATSKELTDVRDGNAHHLVVTKDDPTNEVKVYLDGVLILNSTTASNSASATPWHIARNGTAANYSNPIVQHVAIYSQVLSAARVVAHYNAGTQVADIEATPTSLNFTATQGGSNPASQNVSVTNVGTAGITTFTLSDDQTWLSAAGGDLDAPDTVVVSCDITGLGAGVYTGNVTINPDEPSDSNEVIAITLTVSAGPPNIEATPTSLDFEAIVNGSNPASQNISVTNVGGAGTTTFTVSDDRTWISVGTADLDAPATLPVSIDITGLTAGVYTGTITINPDVVGDPDETVLVTLTLYTHTFPGHIMRGRESGFIVRVDGKRVQHSDLSFSSIRRGGFEACSFTVSQGVEIRRGADVRVWDGTSTAWHGFVNSPGVRRTPGGGRNSSVTAIGYGSKLKLDPFSMVYADSDINRWTGMSPERQASFAATTQPLGGPSVEPSGDGSSSIVLNADGPIAVTAQIEAWYDASPGNKVIGLYLSRVTAVGMVGANFTDAIGQNEVDGSIGAETALLASTQSDTLTTADVSYFSVSGQRYIRIALAVGGAVAANEHRQRQYNHIKVIGDHGLPYSVSGIKVTDIIEHAVKQARDSFDIVNTGGADSEFVTGHAAYYDPVLPEQIVDDMIQLLGWGYGTWEPSLLSSLPVFMYGAPPTDVTATVNYADCSNDSIDEVLTDQFTRAIVISTDAAGKTLRSVIDRGHPTAPADWENTVVFNLGLQGSGVASAHAAFLLALSQDNARAAGSIQLPAKVKVGGSEKPSHMLRPGRERIAIHGVPIESSVIGGNVRGDTFSINRLSVTEDNGVPNVTVELDSGADLVETLSARVELATIESGVTG